MESIIEEDFPIYEIDDLHEEQHQWWNSEEIRDTHLADQIAVRYGNILRHSDSLGWCYYNGKVWVVGAEKKAHMCSEDVVRQIIVESIRKD